ncbi:nitronate monooxygenase [Haloarculaceae archaeon H-GB2-1]|nr:nitronate monooxygenase [Haloarculaceae archaeon H-GB11]MEA5408928.1 nitronate monooxygenase [Haloarculaceae archaeon H-GB2-1]
MPSLRTPLCGVLDVEYPVIQAPVGSVSCPELAAAVSNAGGLGTLAVTWRDFAETRRVIEATRELTDAPFGVNLVLDDDATVYDTEAHVETCLDAGAPVVSFSFGDASPYVGTVHDAGALAAVTVGSAAAAADAVDAGADVVVAQGWEAGGHVQSEVATMPLVPRVADAVGDVPVVAAGGIADGRGVAAALALGADGAWLGTRFVATEEAHAHERYKRALVEAVETDTLHSELFDKGWPGTPTGRSATKLSARGTPLGDHSRASAPAKRRRSRRVPPATSSDTRTIRRFRRWTATSTPWPSTPDRVRASRTRSGRLVQSSSRSSRRRRSPSTQWAGSDGRRGVRSRLMQERLRKGF